MLITVCDVLQERKDDVEKSGGKIARTWNGVMDVQFDRHSIEVSSMGTALITPIRRYSELGETVYACRFIVLEENYSRIYIQ